MQVKGLRSWISRSSDRSRWDKDRRREGEGCFGLADTEVYQECSKVSCIGKLLSLIYIRLCIYC